MSVKFGMDEGTSSMPNFTPNGATCRPCGAKKTQNRPLSKLNTGRLALRAMLPVTRSIGTVYTSAKVRLASAAIWRVSMSRRFMTVNHFPYLPILTNPENNSCIQTVIRIATKI